MFSEKIRRCVYWALDFIKGSQVRKHKKEIKYILENAGSEEVAQINTAHLSALLSHAVNTTNFYKKKEDFCSLGDFDVISKAVIRENFCDFCSEKHFGKKVRRMRTSGSTGAPFEVVQDQNKVNRVMAEMQYMWGTAGYEIGMRYLFLRAWTKQNKKNRITAFARNIIMQNSDNLDEDGLEKIRRRLKSDKKIKMMIGYANTFEHLANYLYLQGDRPEMFSVRTIITTSECLYESTKKKLNEVFGCKVVSLYSNQENGMLAIECFENAEFHLNTASYHFEFLKPDSDEPAEIGEPARIVITDLFNYAMPMIRYDTGDVGILKPWSECGRPGSVLSQIEGRLVDVIYDADGRMISPHQISVAFWAFPDVTQYQFIQTGQAHYHIKIVGEKINSEIIEAGLRELLGSGAVIEIESVGDIPLMSSGKRKYILNETLR